MMLSKFGGLAFLGHYEMASRLVSQFRSLLVNANQIVVPVVAEKIKTDSKEHFQDFYSKMNRLLLLFTFPMSTILIFLTPLISILWIGELNNDFTFSMYVLTVATMINIMCGPSYFSSLGEGRLSILIIVHVGMAFVNFALGYILGWTINGYGIILAWGLALSLGSISLILIYTKKISIKLKDIFTKKDYQLIGTTIFIMTITMILFSCHFISINNFSKLLIAAPLLLAFIPLVMKNENIQIIVAIFKGKIS